MRNCHHKLWQRRRSVRLFVGETDIYPGRFYPGRPPGFPVPRTLPQATTSAESEAAPSLSWTACNAKNDSTSEVVAAEYVSNRLSCNVQRQSWHLYGAAINGNYVIQVHAATRTVLDANSRRLKPVCAARSKCDFEVAAVEYIANTPIWNKSNVRQLRLSWRSN